MLKKKYRAFEIQDGRVSEMTVDGNLSAIAGFVRNCNEGSIILLNTLEGGEPFLIGFSKLFLYCTDNNFLNQQLIPYLCGR